MNKLKISKNLRLAIEASLLAGEEILKIYESDKFYIESKSDNSPLTIADKKSHKVISLILKKTGIPILSEEGCKINYNERKGWDYFWLIDPIDGTKEFIKKNDEFTVNIALIHKNSPILGVVFAPVLKELFFAEENFGSFKLEKINKIEEFNPNNLKDLSKSIVPKLYTVVVSRSHMNSETENFIQSLKNKYQNIKTISFGSSLKICRVAEGYATCYPRFGPTMEWDTAAAHSIAKFSGCEVENALDNKELVYNKENLLNPYFIITKK